MVYLYLRKLRGDYVEQLRLRLEKVILKHFARNTVHGLNRSVIPAKKLENVKVLHNIKDEDVLFIYDATLFGSAKDGMVFTNRKIYWREVLDSPQKLDYKDLIESTANKDLRAKAIFILDQEEEIQIKEVYYKLVCDLRSDLITSSIVYETYYKTALSSATETLARLLEGKQYSQIIGWLTQYEGLYLKPKHKSVKLREISFQAYLIEKMFPKAKEQLEFIEDKNPRFSNKAAPLLERAIKEERMSNLEARRLKAIEAQDFKEAYMLIEEQRALGILDKDDLNTIERATKNAHYDSIDKDRLEAIGEEDYNLAYSFLEQQMDLNIKQSFQIEQIRNTMEESKKSVLKNYLMALNTLLQEGRFLEADKIREQIYKIDSTYPLEREKVLLTIYQYDINKAKQEIAQIPDPALKLELEEILKKTIRKLNEKIRHAARNKAYDIFEKYPDLWHYTDEYSMSAVDYFALEADLEGIFKALEKTEILLMPANIFGHNFVDLIGFACDPNLGNKKEDPLELLKKIKSKIDIKQIDDRIKFLETGQERHFFSYKLKQENKLSELNQKLLSPEYFKQILIEIENQTYNNVDKIIRHMFSGELEDMDSYPEKDEFETSEDYRRRARTFRRQYLNRFDFIAEYKRQNQLTVEGIDKVLKEKKSCFVPQISALVEYKNKELDALKALLSQEDVLGLLDFYFPVEEEVIAAQVGMYDADKEVFLISLRGETYEMSMPLAIAREYRKTFDQVEFVRRRIVKDGQIVMGTVPRYGA